MGRHSATTDDEQDEGSVAVVVLPSVSRGRHAIDDAGPDEPVADADTDQFERVDASGPGRVTGPSPRPTAAAKPPFARNSATRSPPRPPSRTSWPPRAPAAVPTAAPPDVEVAEPEDATTRIPVITEAVLAQPAPAELTDVIPPLDIEPITVAPPAEAAESVPAVSVPFESVPVDAAAAPVTSSPAASSPTGGHATAADLALLRAHGDVRARCLAGLLLPFAIYVVVLLAVGSFTTRIFLIWLAAPIVAAGVLVGVFLDLGHRRHGGTANDPAATASAHE